MNGAQKVLMTCMAGLLSGCTVLPADWDHTLQRTGTTAFEHMACSADGMGQVFLGALKGTLDGTATAIALTDQMEADQTSDADADDILLIVMGTGAVLGLGMGMAEKILDLPTSYKDCLDRQEALREKNTI